MQAGPLLVPGQGLTYCIPSAGSQSSTFPIRHANHRRSHTGVPIQTPWSILSPSAAQAAAVRQRTHDPAHTPAPPAHPRCWLPSRPRSQAPRRQPAQCWLRTGVCLNLTRSSQYAPAQLVTRLKRKRRAGGGHVHCALHAQGARGHQQRPALHANLHGQARVTCKVRIHCFVCLS